MVHLAAIPSKDSAKPLVEGMSKICLQPHPEAALFTSSVYGSRYAAEDLPRHEMPEHEMPKEVAYKMIKDDLSLDGNPMLK
jgi:glutamate decarboxylase